MYARVEGWLLGLLTSSVIDWRVAFIICILTAIYFDCKLPDLLSTWSSCSTARELCTALLNKIKSLQVKTINKKEL